MRLLPSNLAEGPLSRRLAWLTGTRLAFLSVLLGLIGYLGARRGLNLDSFTIQTSINTLAIGFALAGCYAVVLRSGKYLEPLAMTQLVGDQVAWTVVVYLTGGASSGASSLYGLSCVVGAFLTGFSGAATAAVSGIACYGLLVAGLESGVLPLPRDQPAIAYQISAEELAYHALVNALVILVVMLLSGYLAERLAKTGGQLREAEERADQAERMAALGRLAAGLAHEIRNPLGSISGSVRLLATNTALTGDDKELCAIIQREAGRLDDLVTDMMELARPRRPEPVPMDVAEVAQEVVGLAGSSGRAAGDVAVRYDGPSAVTITADPAQMRQLIWNLVRNAVQASSAGGEVVVRVVEVDGGAELSVRDDGIGIDEEAKAQLFDAFFTTRSKGTGVGLAVVKRIVDDHGFRVDVDSERGKGALFRVALRQV